MNKKSLIGERFGRLTVIEYNELISKEKGRKYWKCKCDCGNEKTVRQDSLISGVTKSCGCIKKEQQDLTNKTFSYLTVIKRDFEKEKTVAGHNYYWICQCKCGNFTTVRGADLKNGHTKSCGCLSREITTKRNFEDLSIQKFGYLTPIQKIGVSKNGHSIWKCKCDCGNVVNVLATNLKTGHTISCGCFKKSKGEQKIELFLKKMAVNYKRQYSFDDLTINGTKLRFDFAIFKNNSLMYLVEYQGEQHYDIIEHWGGEKQFYHRQLCDDKKRKYCIEHKIPLIEIHYKDFKNIENILLKMIEF